MGEELHQCDNCGKIYREEELAEIHDFWGRVSPGETMPSGECPQCHALCYPEREEPDRSDRTRIVILLDGGRIDQVFSDAPLDFAVLDPDTEGCDEDEIKTVTIYQEPEEVWFHLREGTVDPERVHRIFTDIDR